MAVGMRSTVQAVSARKVAHITSSRPATLSSRSMMRTTSRKFVASVVPYDHNFPEVVPIAVLRCGPTSAGNGAKSGSTQ